MGKQEWPAGNLGKRGGLPNRTQGGDKVFKVVRWQLSSEGVERDVGSRVCSGAVGPACQ